MNAVAHSSTKSTITVLGIPGSVFLPSTAAAVAIGLVYVLSPLTVWFAAAMAGLFAWALHGLGGRERRWVGGLLALAVAARLVAIAGLFLVSQYQDRAVTGFVGDEIYHKTRSLLMHNYWVGIPVLPENLAVAFDRGYGWSGYLYLLAYLQVLFGPAPYGVNLFGMTLSLTSTIAMHRTVRVAYGPVAALGGLCAMLFTPTLFVWSLTALKESPQLFLSVVSLVAAFQVVRARRWIWRLVAVSVFVGTVVAIDTVRPGALVVTVAGVMCGVAAWFATRRVWLLILCLLVALVGGSLVVNRPTVQESIKANLRRSAHIHVGHVITPGYSYKVMDDRFYFEYGGPVDTMTRAETARYVVRAVTSFFTVPVPWRVASPSALALLPQQGVWYILVLFAGIGFVAGLRHDALLTWLLVGNIAAGVVTVGLNSGNVGTLVRHRDLVVPFVLWLGALGIVSALSRLRRQHVAKIPCLPRLDSAPDLS